MQTLSITVSGKVQGVFFRQTALENARALEITGQARNLSNGDVHIVATGTPEQLEKLSTWCKQGPPRAEVYSVEIRDLPLQLFDKFTVIRS